MDNRMPQSDLEALVAAAKKATSVEQRVERTIKGLLKDMVEVVDKDPKYDSMARNVGKDILRHVIDEMKKLLGPSYLVQEDDGRYDISISWMAPSK